MLQIIREKAQGVIAWTIVAMIAITFTLWGVGDYFGSSSSTSYAAKVDGQRLSWNVVNRAYANIMHYYSTQDGFDHSKFNSTKLKAEIRDSLAYGMAIVLAAQKYGFKINGSQVKEEIIHTPNFQDNGSFSSDKYHNFLRNSEVSESVYQQEVRNKLLFEAMQGGILKSSFSTKQEEVGLYDLLQQTRDFGYALIPSSKYQAEVKISEDEIKDYYEKHKDLFVTDEQVSVSYIKLSMDDLLNKISVTDDELLEYYNQNKDHYAIPEQVHIKHILISAPKGSDAEKSGEAREKAADVLAKLKTGGNFSELAKKFSTDYTSAKNGGDLGWMSEHDADIEFSKAAFALKKLGEISELVQTDFGYHIIKLVARNKAQVKSFAEVKDSLSTEFKRTKARDLLIYNFDELNQLAFEDQQPLETVANKLGLDLKTTNFFSKSKLPEELNSKVALEAFSADLIDGGQNSELIRLDDETEVVLRVDKHIMPYQMDFTAAKPEIIAMLLNRGAKEMAKQDAEKFISQLNEGNLPFKLAEKNTLQWITKNGVGRTGSRDLPKEVTNKVFAMHKPINSKPVNDIVSLPNGDYMVISLQNVSAEKNQDPAIINNLNAKIAYGIGEYEYGLFEQSIITNTKMVLPAIDS
jgi:peptidyl-prolyl cis-trans isomerase D